MRDLIIFGSSGHAADIIDIFEKSDNYRIIGLIDSFRKIGEKRLGYSVIANDDNLKDIIKDNPNTAYFPAVGDNWGRSVVVEKLKSFNSSIYFANAIHPGACIGKNVVLGQGVALFSGANVSAGSVIGDFSILNSNSSIGHNSFLRNYSSLGPGAITGGDFSLGEFSVIAIGAVVREKISVGNNAVVGAGSLLLTNCPDNSLMYGHPAKFVRLWNPGEKYL